MVQKKRRIIFHRKLSLTVALAVSLLIAFLLIKKSNVLPYQLSKYVNEHYLKGSSFYFSCGKISGNLVNQVTLRNVSITYRDETTPFHLFEANELDVNYSLMEVLKLRLFVDDLVVENGKVHLKRDTKGQLILPRSTPSSSSESPGISPYIDLKRLTLTDCSFIFESDSGERVLEDIDLYGSFNLDGKTARLDIENCGAYLPLEGKTLQSLRLSTSINDSMLTLEDFSVRMDRTFLIVRGHYNFGKEHELHIVFNPLNLEELSALGIIPDYEGEIGGNMTTTGTIDSLRMTGTVSGRAWWFLFSGFSFTGIRTPETINVTDLEGTVFGSYLTGKAVYIPGPEGGYTFNGQARGLDIAEGFLPSDVVPKTDLHGNVQMQYSKPLDKYFFTVDLDTSSVDEFKPDKLHARMEWSGLTGLKFNSIEIVNPGFTVSSTGSIDRRSYLDFIFDLKGNDLGYLWDYFSLPYFDTRIAVNGRIAGHIDDFRVNLNGDLIDSRYLFARIDSSTVHAAVKNLPHDSTMATVDITGKHLTLKDWNFEAPHLRIEASSDSVAIKDASFSKGDTLITTDFTVMDTDSSQNLLFKHILIRTPNEVWNSTAPVRLSQTGSITTIKSMLLESNRGEFGFDGTYNSMDRMCNFSAWGKDVESSLFKRLLGLTNEISGKSRFNAELRGNLDNLPIQLDFHLDRGEIAGMKFDGIDFLGEFGSRGYVVDRLTVWNRGDSLEVSGWWKLDHSPLSLAEKVVTKRELRNTPWHFEFTGRRFQVQNVMNLFGKKLFFDGAYDGKVIIGGSPNAPTFTTAGILRSLKESVFQYPDINISLNYKDSLLSVDAVEFDDGKLKGNIAAKLPIAFDVEKGFRVRQRASLEVNAALGSNDLSVMSSYMEKVAQSHGKIEGNIQVRGSMEYPSFTGELDFKNCGFRLAATEETYTNINAKVKLLDNVIQLTTLQGKLGKKGSFYGSGFAELEGFKPKGYRADIFFKDFLFASIQDFVSLQDGNMTIESSGEGRLTPMMTGNLEVKQATITRPIGMDSGPSTLTLPSENPRWFCNIAIDAPKKIMFKNPGLNVELGGRVVLKRDKSGLFLRGELQALRGSYTLYNNKFTITDGIFDFSTSTAFRPEMNINAYTLYRRRSEEDHRIFLNLSWPKEEREPKVSLSYDQPGYSETDIWKMLGGTYVPSGGEDGGSWDPTGTAQSIASTYFERILNAQMSDITVDVETGMTGSSGSSQDVEYQTTIAIGKYLSDDLYLRYRQGLSVTSEREVDIEYRIGHMVIFRSEYIKHSQQLVQGTSRRSTDEINFDIKFRLEY